MGGCLLTIHSGGVYSICADRLFMHMYTKRDGEGAGVGGRGKVKDSIVVCS